MAVCDKCSSCRKDLHEEMEKFKEAYMDGGVVEKKPECKDCDNVEGDDLSRCIVCGETIAK